MTVVMATTPGAPAPGFDAPGVEDFDLPPIAGIEWLTKPVLMLVFSAGIILYTGLFSSPETNYLLTLPLRPERIVLYKFQEAVFFSSWGFFLLASPIMISYGVVARAPWYYYVLLVPLIVSFVYIPCGIGAISCLAIIRFLPQLRKVIVMAAAVAVGGDCRVAGGVSRGVGRGVDYGARPGRRAG